MTQYICRQLPGLHKLFDGRLRSLKTYTEGCFNVATLRLLCPGNKSIVTMSTMLPRIFWLLLPDTVDTIEFCLSEHYILPFVNVPVIQFVQFIQLVRQDPRNSARRNSEHR